MGTEVTNQVDEVLLTPVQCDAADRAMSSVRARKRLFRIGGYAGCGKTTLAKRIVAAMPGGAVCAFTGKAASVLRAKGMHEATTIHKRIYKYNDATETFSLRHRRELADVQYFLLDEASMVNSKQWDDMQSFKKPIIAIGDPGQLQPVGDDPRLMVDPDIVLTEIHRQAAENAIIQFATHVRAGKPIRRGTKGEVQIGNADLFWDSLGWADVMLCGFNKTRIAVNQEMRSVRYGDGRQKLMIGERIVCLKNDEMLGVSNGELFTVTDIIDQSEDGWYVDLVDSEDVPHPAVSLKAEAFGVAKPDSKDWKQKGVMYADYGYCLSVHKFQGSEADKVAVMHEQCSMWCPIRWSYTAITRAAKELRYAI